MICGTHTRTLLETTGSNITSLMKKGARMEGRCIRLVTTLHRETTPKFCISSLIPLVQYPQVQAQNSTTASSAHPHTMQHQIESVWSKASYMRAWDHIVRNVTHRGFDKHYISSQGVIAYSSDRRVTHAQNKDANLPQQNYLVLCSAEGTQSRS